MRQFQSAMMGSYRQIHLTHRRSHQTLPLILQLAKRPHFPYSQIGITYYVCCFSICKSLVLNIPFGLGQFTNAFTCFSQTVIAQLFLIHTLHRDVDYYPVQHKPEIRFLIFGNDRKHTPTGFLYITPVPTWAGTQSNIFALLDDD